MEPEQGCAAFMNFHKGILLGSGHIHGLMICISQNARSMMLQIALDGLQKIPILGDDQTKWFLVFDEVSHRCHRENEFFYQESLCALRQSNPA